MNLNIQNSWPNWLSTYHGQFSTGNHFHVKWTTNPRGPQFFQQQVFPSVPSLVDFNSVLFFEVSTSIICVLIWPRQSLFTVCFRIFTVPVVWSILGIAVLRPPRLVQLFLKASSLSSRVRIRPLRSLRIICFRNFSRHANAPPLKTPLAPSPPSFNHSPSPPSFNYSIIFESLLLNSYPVNLPTPIAPNAGGLSRAPCASMNFTLQNSTMNLCQLQLSCIYPFSPLSSA